MVITTGFKFTTKFTLHYNVMFHSNQNMTNEFIKMLNSFDQIIKSSKVKYKNFINSFTMHKKF